MFLSTFLVPFPLNRTAGCRGTLNSGLPLCVSLIISLPHFSTLGDCSLYSDHVLLSPEEFLLNLKLLWEHTWTQSEVVSILLATLFNSVRVAQVLLCTEKGVTMPNEKVYAETCFHLNAPLVLWPHWLASLPPWQSHDNFALCWKRLCLLGNSRQ